MTECFEVFVVRCGQNYWSGKKWDLCPYRAKLYRRPEAERTCEMLNRYGAKPDAEVVSCRLEVPKPPVDNAYVSPKEGA